MALNNQQVDRFLDMIRHTKEVELTCPECLDELDRFVQKTLDGMPIDEKLALVREHLDACRCCTNQFKLVLDTLEAIDE